MRWDATATTDTSNTPPRFLERSETYLSPTFGQLKRSRILTSYLTLSSQVTMLDRKFEPKLAGMAERTEEKESEEDEIEVDTRGYWA